MKMQTVRIAGQKSKLALVQSQKVIDLLKQKYKDVNFEIVTVETLGDKNLKEKLSEIGTKGLFTFEIEQMLITGSVDMAVHSLKDMPTDFIRDLKIGAYIKRESNKDVIVFNKDYKSVKDLPKNAKIGTSSLRREVQIKKLGKDFEVANIRGNIHTRLKRMKEENFDAIILAKVALTRLNLQDELVFEELPFISAAGQGCICVQVKKDNKKIEKMLEFLNDVETQKCVTAEREFLHTIGGGCHTPVGAYCQKIGQIYRIDAFVSSLDGKKYLSCEIKSKNTENLGKQTAQRLIAKGADKIVK